MAKSRRRLVWERAAGRCEYCWMPQRYASLPHELDHTRARKHRGASTTANMCLACANCNAAKGSNVAGFDPVSDQLVPLFNPRSDVWSEHFAWDRHILVGLTAIGRATVDVLRINDPLRLEHRRLLSLAGLYPRNE
jgi:hypothetical protein